MSETKWFAATDRPNAEVLVVDEAGALVAIVYSAPNADDLDERRHLIAAAPALVDIVHRLCVQLGAAGVEAKADSLNPLEALHADALAAYGAATGDGNPFGTALAGICADNRAALARGESPSPEEESRG